MARYLDWLLQEVVRAVLAYAERIQRRCGDADALLGPVDGARSFLRLRQLIDPKALATARAVIDGIR